MNKIKGFTLIEVVVTIAIIIVLSIISGPIYNSYSAKAKLTEGYALLGTVRSAQEAYFQKYDRFFYHNGNTCYNEVLGIDARPNKYFTSFHITSTDGCKFWVQTGSSFKTISMIYNMTQGVTFK